MNEFQQAYFGFVGLAGSLLLVVGTLFVHTTDAAARGYYQAIALVILWVLADLFHNTNFPRTK